MSVGTAGGPAPGGPPGGPVRLTAAKVASPSFVTALVREGRVRPKRRLGQHFLVDRHVVERVVTCAAGDEGLGTTGVVEIGAGLGALTLALAEAGASRVVALEKDPDLVAILVEAVAPWPGIEVVLGDALEFDLRRLVGTGLEPVVVGNLPYSVTTPLLLRLLEPPVFWSRAVVTVQLEVAERILAFPGTKEYGSLTLAVQAAARAEAVLRVPPHCFYPRPEVESTVLVLRRRGEPAGGLDPRGLRRLERVVRAAFGQRRKKVGNALAAGLRIPRDTAIAALERAGLDPGRRGETLSLEEFVQLTRSLDGVWQGE